MSEQKENFDNEFRERLYERYESRSRSFSTTFRATMIFTFAFLAFVLVPLVALEYDDHRIRIKEAVWQQKKDSIEKLEGRITQINDRLPQTSQEHKQIQQEVENTEQELGEIEDEVEQIRHQIDKNTQELNLYLEKTGEFKEIQARFDELETYDPRKSAQELIHAFAQMLDRGRPDPADPCASPDMEKFVRCRVENSLQAQLKAYKQVIADADQLLLQYEALNGVKPIDDKIDAVLKALDQLIVKYPDFWRTIRGKLFFFGEFNTPMKEAFIEAEHQMKRYDDALGRRKIQIDANFTKLESTGKQLEKDKLRVSQTRDELQGELAEKTKQIQALKAEEQQLTQELAKRKQEIELARKEFQKLDKEKQEILKSKSQIEKRLEKVQSPFGTIPVGLKEAILVFPVIVAAGIVLYCLIFLELLRVRKAFHLATEKMYGENAEELENRMAMVAPLWLDPLGSVRGNIGGIILLALPAVAFFLSLLLIGYSWQLAGTQQGSTPIIHGMYIVLYGLSAMGMILCSVLILKQWKNYKTRP
ncbi:MAG: hypothetical protein D3926_22715 [Desulfobacteraceae bacterium]|nr:MAG: hypothetical protein D3926_22715 [Desulfobacteraceae bacterium]